MWRSEIKLPEKKNTMASKHSDYFNFFIDEVFGVMTNYMELGTTQQTTSCAVTP
jgi:hypothetical protein